MPRARGAVLSCVPVVFLALTSLTTSGQTAKKQSQPERDPGQRQQKPTPLGMGVPGVHPTPILLLQTQPVQNELGLTRDQIKKIEEINQQYNQKRIDSAQNLSKGARGIDQEALMEMIQTVRRENEETLAGVLKPSQRARLKQISLQAEGVQGLVKPEIASEVNLSPDQVEQINLIVAQMKESQAQLFKARVEMQQARLEANLGKEKAKTKPTRTTKPTGDLNVLYLEQFEKLQELTLGQISRVLTRRQGAKFKSMLGEPFDFSPLRPGSQREVDAGPPDDEPRELAPIPRDNRPKSPQTREQNSRENRAGKAKG